MMVNLNVKFAVEYLHIGTGNRNDPVVDNPIAKEYVSAYTVTPYIPTGAIRGLLRRTAFRISNTLFKNTGFPPLNTEKINHTSEPEKKWKKHPFFTLFGAPNLPGKLKITNVEITGPKRDITLRPGIRVERWRGSAAEKALFFTEFAEIETISADLTCADPNDYEGALLIASIGASLFDRLGGKGTIGAGLILDVHPTPRDNTPDTYIENVKKFIKKLLSSPEEDVN